MELGSQEVVSLLYLSNLMDLMRLKGAHTVSVSGITVGLGPDPSTPEPKGEHPDSYVAVSPLDDPETFPNRKGVVRFRRDTE